MTEGVMKLDECGRRRGIERLRRETKQGAREEAVVAKLDQSFECNNSGWRNKGWRERDSGGAARGSGCADLHGKVGGHVTPPTSPSSSSNARREREELVPFGVDPSGSQNSGGGEARGLGFTARKRSMYTTCPKKKVGCVCGRGSNLKIRNPQFS